MKLHLIVELKPKDGWTPGTDADFGGPVLIEHAEWCPADGKRHEEVDSVLAFSEEDVVSAIESALTGHYFEGYEITDVFQGGAS